MQIFKKIEVLLLVMICGWYTGAFCAEVIDTKTAVTGLPTKPLVAMRAPDMPTIMQPFDFARLPSLQPQLRFFSTDPEGDEIQYRVFWDIDPSFTGPESITTALYPSGNIVDFIFPWPLRDSSTYWWRVKCSDPLGSGQWSQYTNRRSFTVGPCIPDSTCSWYQTTGTQFGTCTFHGTRIAGDSVVLVPITFFEDTLLYENFESGMPPGWTVIDGNNDGIAWTTGTTGSIGSYPPPGYGTTYAYYCDDDAGNGTVNFNEELVSPAVFVPALAANLGLRYGYGLRTWEAGEKFRVKLRKFIDGSWGIWRDIAMYTSDGSGTAAIDLSLDLPADSIQLEWFFSDSTSSSHWSWACATDNIYLYYSYTFQNNAGDMTGVPVRYSDLSGIYPRTGWGDATWHKASPADSIGIQVEYYDGSAWGLVPDALVPGNSAGIFSTLALDTVKLMNIDTLIYNVLRIKSLLFRSQRAPEDPALLDWEVGNLSRYFGVTEAEAVTGLVAEFGLRVYPSIAERDVRINYCIGHSAKSGALKIYDASGRVIKSFALSPSPYALSLAWNGTDGAGRLVPAGVYFVKLEAGDRQAVQKTVLLR